MFLLDLEHENVKIRNLLAWAAVGFLFYGLIGSAVLVLIYLAFDTPRMVERGRQKKLTIEQTKTWKQEN